MDGRTDRQTDRRLTVASPRSALASRGKNIGKVFILKFLHGSVVTQTVLGGLTIHVPVANFLRCMCQKL